MLQFHIKAFLFLLYRLSNYDCVLLRDDIGLETLEETLELLWL
jgi:hypothetical protein